MNIKELRTQHGLTQKQLAALIGVTSRTVERWESGDRVPSPQVLELLQIKLSELGRQRFEIPFMGFYETSLSAHLEDELDREGLEVDAVDWAATRQRIARAYAETWLHKMGLTGVFVEMLSPREYNFETDRLVVTVVTY